MSQSVTYQQIHSYMLQKTREYRLDPPAELVDALQAEASGRGEPLTRAQAREQVSLIEIQRYLRREMTEKWPEFMASIPVNPLRED